MGEARDGFRNVETAIGTLPLELQRTLLTEMMRASIEVGDITGAIKQMHEFETVGVPTRAGADAVGADRPAGGRARHDRGRAARLSLAADSGIVRRAAQGAAARDRAERSLGN